ncbi:MAG: hypothetical protein PHQ60_08410 [Sideroxydans sp.]|nr:hypothetical protein [Sideroxydans sp.]
MAATEILSLSKFNEMLPGILHKYTTHFSTPGAVVFSMIEFGIYSTPILAVFLVRKWITIQLIVVAEIVALLKYGIDELLTVQMATANGCSGCEALGFGQAIFSFAILLSSLVFFSIANLIEKNVQK